MSKTVPFSISVAEQRGAAPGKARLAPLAEAVASLVPEEALLLFGQPQKPDMRGPKVIFSHFPHNSC
jgi:hypothetical protein